MTKQEVSAETSITQASRHNAIGIVNGACLVHLTPTTPILHPCAPSSLSMFLYMCSFYVRALLVLFLVLPACVLWAVFMLICPFHAGTWPIAADRCGSVRWSDLSCGCAVPRPHPSPQFLKGPQEALRGQLGRRRACGLASLRPCILVSAHDSALDSDSGLEPPPRDAQTCRRRR